MRQQGRPIVQVNRRDDLVALSDLVQAGKLKAVIDQMFPLADAADAVGHVGDGHAQGTTVITM